MQELIKKLNALADQYWKQSQEAYDKGEKGMGDYKSGKSAGLYTAGKTIYEFAVREKLIDLTTAVEKSS